MVPQIKEGFGCRGFKGGFGTQPLFLGGLRKGPLVGRFFKFFPNRLRGFLKVFSTLFSFRGFFPRKKGVGENFSREKGVIMSPNFPG